ncbi:MAG: helix-turn-helix transcriptional regulator [Pseudomonadota bacterium]
MPKPYSEVGKFVRVKMIESDVTLGGLAEKIGCSSSQLSNQMRGLRPISQAWADRVSLALGLNEGEAFDLATLTAKETGLVSVADDQAADTLRFLTLRKKMSPDELDRLFKSLTSGREVNEA